MVQASPSISSQQHACEGGMIVEQAVVEWGASTPILCSQAGPILQQVL